MIPPRCWVVLLQVSCSASEGTERAEYFDLVYGRFKLSEARRGSGAGPLAGNRHPSFTHISQCADGPGKGVDLNRSK